jgi:hypothetical protein
MIGFCGRRGVAHTPGFKNSARGQLRMSHVAGHLSNLVGSEQMGELEYTTATRLSTSRFCALIGRQEYLAYESLKTRGSCVFWGARFEHPHVARIQCIRHF